MVSASLLKAEITEKNVVYTATCFEDFYKSAEGTQLLVEISKLGLEPLPVPASFFDAIRYITGTIDIVKGALKLGVFIVPEFAPVLETMAGVGSIFQALLSFIPDDRPNEVVETMKRLEKSIHEVETKMREQFTDMKGFLVESEFSVDVISEASVLMRLMRNCMKYQNQEAIDNFTKAYKKQSPLELVYIMVSHLEQRTTNPLIMAMEGDKTKSKETFEKWEKIIKGVFGELLLIERFASGLLSKKTQYDTDRIFNRLKEVSSDMETLKEKYMNMHWEELREFMKTYAAKHTHLTNSQKADELKTKLDSISTDDAFYVLVFNQCKSKTDYFYRCPNEKDQIIGTWDEGLCNVLIYRSRDAHNKTDEQYKKMENEVEKCRNDTLFYTGDFSETTSVQIVEQERVSDQGFLFVCHDSKDLQIRSASCPKREWGPGWWINANFRRSTNWNEVSKKTFIAAFP